MKKFLDAMSSKFKISRKKYFISILLLSVLFTLFLPVAYAGDPWYIKPLIWMLDLILGLLGGIHDPMDHVFNGGCGVANNFFRGCPDYSVWGIWTEEQFTTAIYRGFMLFSIVASAIVTTSVIKSGVLLSLKNLSSTTKFEVNDALIKATIAIVLLSQFFVIVGFMFSMNSLIVNLAKQDLRGNINVTTSEGELVPSSGKVIESERIQMNDLNISLDDVTNTVGESVVSLSSKAVGIWWEVFYLQRKLMIGILLVLAPVWICLMFYPSLHGVTAAAMKELWSQIIAQGLHAVLFWFFFKIMDNQMGWFQILVAMCLFIPLSESVRFILGANAQTGGKLAAIGTLAGAAGIMNMTKAVASIGKGGLNAIKASRGLPTSNYSGGSMNNGIGVMAQNGVGAFAGSGYAERGGHNFSTAMASRVNNNFSRKLRAAGELGAGFGSAGLRMAGTFTGVGLGPFGAFAMGEVGAKAGDRVGYSAGAGTYVAGSSAASGAKAVGAKARQLPQNYKDAYSSMTNRDGDKPTRVVKSAAAAIRGGSSNQPLTPEQEGIQQAKKLEKTSERWGAAAEVVFGRGGFEVGDNYAKSKFPGRSLTAGKLNDLSKTGTKTVYTVETQDSSMLAYQNPQGEFVPISNYGKGNMSLKRGETAVSAYSIQGEGNQVRMVPVKMKVEVPVEGGSSQVEYVNSSHVYTESGKIPFSGKPADPHQFISPRREDEHVDLKRKNFVAK